MKFRRTPRTSCDSQKKILNASRFSSNGNTENDEGFINDYRSDTITNKGLGTPKITKLETPSSARFRSRVNRTHGSTSQYVSPKKKLNFDR